MEGQSQKENEHVYKSAIPLKDTSMSTLIVWNINKALENNPNMVLLQALKSTQENLERNSVDVLGIMSQKPEERHLYCAMLAWQQLGHLNADSLYRFVEAQKKEEAPRHPKVQILPSYSGGYVSPMDSKEISGTNSMRGPAIGPVLRLPQEPKIVMRMDSSKPAGSDIKKKIEEACCLESGCVERLAKLDAQTKELRSRLAKLARREADRVDLLEKAEAAWRDLEIGYMKRHRDVVEKEGDLERQKEYLLNDRNDHKEYCAKLVEVLRPRGDAAEALREQLRNLETTVCERACERMRQIELSAAEDAALAEVQCQATQLDRDLQFKEEQARRKKSVLESDLESARGLTYEAERTLRSELNGLKQQIKQVSKELLDEDNAIGETKKQLEELQNEKRDLVEDLEGCQNMCDANMQKKVDELKTKRLKLQELKNKVVDCKCQLPMDVAVEVKRTPSIAALCHCKPEDKALDSCSCTSFRSRLLSDLLSDLFGGLQGELGNTGTKMPCQLLKCLEDRHNWDRASVVKSNLRAFFAKLLVGELDIAIATSIEKYHAKWVGASCADIARPIPDYGGSENEGWEQRALEYKAKRMATQMAEQMFKEHAEEIMQRAKDVVAMGPPPCDCKPQSIMTCLVEQRIIGGRSEEPVKDLNKSRAKSPIKKGSPVAQRKLNQTNTGGNGHIVNAIHRTINNVSQLQAQVEDLKKDTITKEDLKIMQKRIAKIAQRISAPDSCEVPNKTEPDEKTIKKENEYRKPVTTGSKTKKLCPIVKKKQIYNEPVIKPPGKTSKRFNRQYAVNLCLCGMRDMKDKNDKPKEDTKAISQTLNIRQSKPISQMMSKEDEAPKNSESTPKNVCGSHCACFNKIPSISSFDKLLETLAKWKCDLGNDCNGSKTDNNNIMTPTAYNYLKSASDNVSSNMNHVSKINSKSRNKSPERSFKIPEVKSNQYTANKEIKNDIIHSTQKQGYDFGRILTTNTESEYMGAINLEKSNENFCKCVINGETNINEQTKNDESNMNTPVKLNHSCKCDKAEDNLIDDKRVDPKNNDLTPHNDENNKNKSIVHNVLAQDGYVLETQDHKNRVRNVMSDNLHDKTNIKRDKAASSIKIINKDEKYINNHEPPQTVSNGSQIIKTPECDCGYQIKFLGVTLSNKAYNKKHLNIPKKESKTVTYMPKHKNKVENPFDTYPHNLLDNSDSFKIKVDDNKNKVEYPLDAYPHNLLDNSDSFKSKVDYNTNNIDNNQPVCPCNVNLKEIQAFFSNNLHRNIGDSKHHDKALDTASFMQEVIEKEDCVCCVKDLVEECNDLEVNTFHLLEEHLKKKLEDFKESCHHSSCIDPNEERKLFKKILQKVKQTISENTDKLLCKCSDEAQSEGSWQRAYSLLQEYLKTKIQRVQCTCESDNVIKDDIVPELTSKVCNLIENDFERLKEICKCKNTETVARNSKLNESNKFQMPEKDTNVKDVIPSQNYVKSDKITVVSNMTTLKTQNMSAQVLPKLENKSCDVITDHVMRTVGTQDINTEISPFSKFKHCICCGYSSNEKDIIHQSTQYSKTNQDFKNIQHSDSLVYQVMGGNNLLQDIEKTEKPKDNIITIENLSKTTALPLRGYTVDCTCNQSLGPCVCTKSMVHENNVDIDNLWKTHTTRKGNNNVLSYSYIMDNIHKKDDKHECKLHHISEYTDTELLNQMPAPHLLCDVNTSAQDIGSISLKISKEDVTVTPTYNTSMNTVVETNEQTSSISEALPDEAAEWFECSSQAGYETMRTKSRHTPKKTYEVKSDTLVGRISDQGTTIGHITQPSELVHEGCGCSLVPVCHVKMLVENIENKLFNSECTCDAMSAEVCPVHSRRSVV